MNNPPEDTDYRTRYSTKTTQPYDVERRIPLIQERLNVQKSAVREDAVITKEPTRETKTVEVPVRREELTIERRPASGRTEATGKPVESPTEVRVPLEHEEVSTTKTPEVTEEVVARKTPVTETRRVTDEVKGERIRSTGSNVSTRTVGRTTDEDEE